MKGSRFFLTSISHEQVVNLVKAKQACNPTVRYTQLVDVRSTAETARTGIIPTAVNIPLSILTDVLDEGTVSGKTFEHTFGITRPEKGVTRLVFYCAHGIRSAAAVEIATQLGYPGSLNYAGSWAQWEAMMATPSTKTVAADAKSNP